MSISEDEVCGVGSCTILRANRKTEYCMKHRAIHRKYGDPEHADKNSANASHPLYKTWRGMKQRTSNPNTWEYKYYGGKGVRICERWLNSFEAFVEDMGEKPSTEYTLDRIDCDGNYEPKNCRWATPYEQSINKRPRGTSLAVGVCYTARGAWVARLVIAKRKVHESYHRTEEDAIIARNMAVKMHIGTEQ